MKYRKKPIVIEAVQFTGTGESCSAITEFFMAANFGSYYWKGTTYHGGYIKTLEGEMEFHPGDWIIKGIKGEFYPCKPDIFAATYEPVNDDPFGFNKPAPTMVAGDHESGQLDFV